MEISVLEEDLIVLLRNTGKQLISKATSYPRRVGFFKLCQKYPTSIRQLTVSQMKLNAVLTLQH